MSSFEVFGVGDEPSVTSRRGFRVLYVNDIAFIVDTLRAELVRRGIQPELVGRPSSAPSSPRKGFLRSVEEIQKAILTVPDFDLLHLNYGLFGPFAIETDKPVVLHCHGSDIRPGRAFTSRLANLVTKMSLKMADRVWYSTTDLSRYFLDLNVPHRYMPNPVAEAFFRTPAALPERPHVLFAVPLTYLKGADMAIEAMRLVVREGAATVSAFGYPSRYVESAALRSKIPTTIRVLPWTPHDRMPELMSSAAVIVGRLRMGSLGITELEAMAACRPLIAYQAGSVKEIESYYETDPPLLSCGSGAEVAEAVMSCLADRSRALDIGRRNRQWAEHYHSPSVVAELYDLEYREAAPNGP